MMEYTTREGTDIPAPRPAAVAAAARVFSGISFSSGHQTLGHTVTSETALVPVEQMTTSDRITSLGNVLPMLIV